MTTQTFIVYAKRTPIGKISGAFATVPAPQLAAPLVKDALNATGLKGEDVDKMIMGCVLPAGVPGRRRSPVACRSRSAP